MRETYHSPALIVALVLPTFVGMMGCGPPPGFEAEYKRFHSIKVGMHEDEAKAILGNPTHEYSKANAPVEYYVEGWSFKKRPIMNKVLIFIAGESIAYIWLDDNGEVEEVFVGGS